MRRYVVWSPDASHVALLAKNAVIIADRNLKQICAVTESMAVRVSYWGSGVYWVGGAVLRGFLL